MIQSAAASVVILLAIWWTVAIQMNIPYIVPRPEVVLAKLFELLQSEDFGHIMMGTLKHVMVGFVIATVSGIVTGLLAGKFKWVNTFVYPWVVLFRTTPVMSFILYLLLFVATDWVAVWVSVFVVYPMIHVSVLQGYKQVDSKLIEMATLYQVPFEQQLKNIYLPSILPYFMSAAVTGMGINIKAVITAEAMALPDFSIGTQLFNARNYLETETIIAWTLIIIGLAVILDLLLYGIKWLATEGRRNHAIRRRSA